MKIHKFLNIRHVVGYVCSFHSLSLYIFNSCRLLLLLPDRLCFFGGFDIIFHFPRNQLFLFFFKCHLDFFHYFFQLLRTLFHQIITRTKLMARIFRKRIKLRYGLHNQNTHIFTVGRDAWKNFSNRALH
jgi:hypothetical protein